MVATFGKIWVRQKILAQPGEEDARKACLGEDSADIDPEDMPATRLGPRGRLQKLVHAIPGGGPRSPSVTTAFQIEREGGLHLVATEIPSPQVQRPYPRTGNGRVDPIPLSMPKALHSGRFFVYLD